MSSNNKERDPLQENGVLQRIKASLIATWLEFKLLVEEAVVAPPSRSSIGVEGQYLLFADEGGSDKVRVSQPENSAVASVSPNHCEASLGWLSMPIYFDLGSYDPATNTIVVWQKPWVDSNIKGIKPFRMKLWQDEMGILFLKKVPFCYPDSLMVRFGAVYFTSLGEADVELGLKLGELQAMRQTTETTSNTQQLK